MIQEYYDLLGLNSGATTEEIRRAFRAKAKLYHPDTNHTPGAHFQFIRIKEALDILLKVKQLNCYKHYRSSGFYHPHDPYFQPSRHYHSYQRSAYAHHSHEDKNDPHDYPAGRIGRTLYLLTHILFVFIGLLIFAGPLYTLLTRGFDPYRSLFDSVFTMVFAMAFGVIMMYKISGSILQFFKKGF
ncbi:MAG: J domain-containing protein [Bacteroidales bacterium]|nr:J domain-containing protein [Bacteroidales bacterium]